MVIYIIGDRRSGTTLLDYLLSVSDDTVSVGEMSLLDYYYSKKRYSDKYKFHALDDFKCTCGKYIVECVFWGKVLKRFMKYNSDLVTKCSVVRLYEFLSRVYRVKDLKKYVICNNKRSLDNHIILYEIIYELSGKINIVDSSKDIEMAIAMNDRKDLDARYIYVERSVLDVYRSKVKWRKKVNDKILVSEMFKTFLWTMFVRIKNRFLLKQLPENLLYKLKYNDLVCGNVEKKIKDIYDKFGVELKDYVVPIEMDMTDFHNIAGTPNRFSVRKIKKC